MPIRVGVLASNDHPSSRSSGDAWRAQGVQPRRLGAGAGGVRPNSRLSEEQIDSLMEDRRSALLRVLGARMDIANLLNEREPGNLRSLQTVATEDRARHYFDSASDGTLKTVDAHLGDLERYLRDPGTQGGGKYDYRPFTPYEEELQRQNLADGNRGFAALHSSAAPNTVGVNYPAYIRDPGAYRLETQIHEWLHAAGFSQKAKELYGDEAVERAKRPGGTAWAINQNPENAAMFVVRREPAFKPMPRWSPSSP